MNISSIAVPALVVDPDEPVSKVSSLLFRMKTQAAVVARGGTYVGVVHARSLAKKAIANPEKEKIKKYAESVTLLASDASLEQAANVIVVNRHDALPIQNGLQFRMVEKLDVLRALKSHPSFAKAKARDLLKPAICVNQTDSVASCLALLRKAGITHLPVVDRQNRLQGIVEATDLLRTDISRSRAKQGEVSGEKVKLSQIQVSSVMRQPLMVLPDASVSVVIERMAAEKFPTAIVVDSDTNPVVRGILTPTPLLKLTGKPVPRIGQGPAAGIYMNLSGFQNEDPFVVEGVDGEVTAFLQKIAKRIPVDYIVLHQDRHEEKHSHRMRHDVKARLITEKGFFFARAEAWETGKAVKQVLERLQREVTKKQEKAR